jgi:hypothetical protein
MLKLLPLLPSKYKIWGNRNGICRFNTRMAVTPPGRKLRAIGLCKLDLKVYKPPDIEKGILVNGCENR